MERSAQVFEGDKKQAEEIERLELEQRVAHERIGRLTIENEFFKKIGTMDTRERKALIDSDIVEFGVTCRLPLKRDSLKVSLR